MKLPLYKVDVFASARFRGNPAAVCPLPAWPEDDLLRAIAAENNLSETAFLVEEAGRRQLRWFTPTTEVDLCGHATLATAYVLWARRGAHEHSLAFATRSGTLTVERRGDLLALDLPASASSSCTAPAALLKGLKISPKEVWTSREGPHDQNLMAVFSAEADVRDLAPDVARFAALDHTGVIVTAPGYEVDFVSRYFAPAFGIDEDPATGAIHAALAPFWAERLGRNDLLARQLSPRGGELSCTVRGDRVLVAGRVVPVFEGEIEVA